MKQASLQIFNPPAGTEFGATAPGDVVARMLATLRCWHQRSVQRDRLARLAHYRLDDIGLTEAQRRAEISKPFWRA